MREIIELSKRQPDLLAAPSAQLASNVPEKVQLVLDKKQDKKLEAPKTDKNVVPHALLVHGPTTPSFAGLVQHHRNICGGASSEHFINELHSASKINRGPEGFSASSRLHLDMLLNRDESISPSDYLNFDKERW